MADSKQSSAPSQRTSPFSTNTLVHVAACSTFSLAVGWLVAVAVKFGARVAIERRDALEKITPAGRDVNRMMISRPRSIRNDQMPECQGCKQERKDSKKRGRQLIRLPSEVTQDGTFTRKGLPVMLCKWCDGDTLDEAMKAHDKRVSK